MMMKEDGATTLVPCTAVDFRFSFRAPLSSGFDQMRFHEKCCDKVKRNNESVTGGCARNIELQRPKNNFAIEHFIKHSVLSHIGKSLSHKCEGVALSDYSFWCSRCLKRFEGSSSIALSVLYSVCL